MPMDTNLTLIGQTVRGRYHIIEQLGRGGMGITFLAEDKQCFNTRCVVKQLNPQSNDPKTLEVARRLFNREADTMNKLGYEDRIPRLLAYFEDNNDFFLVQELIDGRDLSYEIVPGTCLTPAKVTDLLIDILEVLAVVQKYNVIHRDIKPSNLMRRKKDGKIVAIDFGSVKQVTTQVVDTQGQVRPTVAVGTEAYMPIEQMMGHPGFYSDIYAVGVIAIQALSGIVPRSLAIDSDGELVWRVRLPGNLAQSNLKLLNVIDRMVRYRFQERYRCAMDVLNDLRSLPVKQGKIPSTTIITDSPRESTDSKAATQKNQISPTKPNRKPLLTILATSVIVAIGTLAAILLRSPDTQTADIETQPLSLESYENRDYGFTINYPQGWEQEQRDDFFTRGVVFNSSLDGSTDNFEENISILVENLPPNTSIEGYTNDSIREIQKLSDPNVTTPQSVSIANKMGKTVTYQGEDNGQSVRRKQTWTIDGDRAYIVTYTATPEQFDTYLPTVEKMLESFAIVAK
jgi:eukaryotic-like serine/threonine-protein kinase